jgi:hypothetical protein
MALKGDNQHLPHLTLFISYMNIIMGIIKTNICFGKFNCCHSQSSCTKQDTWNRCTQPFILVRFGYCCFLGPNTPILPCKDCHTYQSSYICGRSSIDNNSNCLECTNLNYECVNSLLDVKILSICWSAFCTRRMRSWTEQTAPEEWEVGLNKLLLPPQYQNNDWLKSGLCFAFFNYHAKEHEMYLWRLPSGQARGIILSS